MQNYKHQKDRSAPKGRINNRLRFSLEPLPVPDEKTRPVGIITMVVVTVIGIRDVTKVSCCWGSVADIV